MEFINCLVLKLNKHNFLNTSLHIKLPEIIIKIYKCKRAFVHFENKDEFCFTYSIKLALDIFNKKLLGLNHLERIKYMKK